MIEKIIEYAIRNRFIVVMATLVLVAWGVYAVVNTPVDAIPDLSENQVIVFTDWMGRSPKEIEDQITYPLSVNLQGLAGVKAVRSSSEFNFSMINVIFEDDIDFYFARQRVLERLTLASTFLPPGVAPYLAPDATALGQIFWYTVEGDGYDPGRLRAIQDWYIRYQLNSVSGVAQVASVGGYPIEYQIDVDPNKLRAYGVTLGDVFAAVARSNSAVGGRVIHKGNAEYLIRGVGWLGADGDVVRDIERIVITADPVRGTPVYVSNVANVGVGTQFRRSVLEKNGNEVVGAVVMMRYGENPLKVTQAIKKKIEQLQAGLPDGVRIVPFYDRTRLIHGAIHTLSEILTHEMIIASAAILLILWHVRSALVICCTLPLSVLSSFILMRWFQIPSNIMSLAGIAISIGVLVDQAIVMVENATHHLTAKFGKAKVHGDTRELVLPACRTVGRPIFFSVMIILISFLPVFALKGIEGKTFHPLAFTKSFAMVGVAVLSITLVPALIPTLIKGRIRSEDESWIVRTMIDIYKPVLTWALPRWNLVLWLFAVLLVLGAGLFPLQAVFGIEWRTGFLATWAVTTTLTVVFMHGGRAQLAGLLSLVAIGYWAYGFDKIGVEYMPVLDEGSAMDMPITVPRASVTQAADDIKMRDEILRGFPEVELVVGKAGRAETATDPAPLDMIETVIMLRPKELWPRRGFKLNPKTARHEDAVDQTRVVLTALENHGFVRKIDKETERESLVNTAYMNAVDRFDAAMRTLLSQRHAEFEAQLGPQLAQTLMKELIDRWNAAGQLLRPVEPDEASRAADRLSHSFGTILAAGPAQEDVNRLIQQAAHELSAVGAVKLSEDLMRLHLSPIRAAWLSVIEPLGVVRPTLFTELYDFVHQRREALWREHAARLDREIFDPAVSMFNWCAIEELQKAAVAQGLWIDQTTGVRGRVSDEEGPASAGTQHSVLSASHSVLSNPHSVLSDPHSVLGTAHSVLRTRHLASHSPLGTRHSALPTPHSPLTLQDLRAELDGPFAKRLLLWKKTKKELAGPGGEMDRTIQMPGWGNIFTQPIINRIDMLATGIRTPVGVKVFGKDLQEIQQVSEEIARAIQQVPGVGNVFPDQNVGKGYLEITIDRDRAARYGVRVGDVQDVIEVALGGKPITLTVEGRERHPVRIRYARDFRQDEESVKNLLVSAGGSMEPGGVMGDPSGGINDGMAMSSMPTSLRADGQSPGPTRPLQVPLKMVADVKIVEGPAMIKSENGLLRSYVQATVGDRDILGFVEEAQRVVAQQVKLPPGMYIEWSGEFEHQIRARNTLRVVLPAVMLLIFIILYMTYNDFVDAVLMMMAVPEALVGGILFLWLSDANFSVAVWVGFIACFGMATETGIIMLVYLREAIERRGGLEKIKSLDELRQAVIEGAVHRLRPKLLTEGVAIVALAPMLWHTGVGHEVISAMAAPVLGGLLIADEVVDIFIPVRFYWVRRHRWLKLHGEEPAGDPA